MQFSIISFCLDFEIGYPRFLDNDRGTESLSQKGYIQLF